MNRNLKILLIRGLIAVAVGVLASNQDSFAQRRAGVSLGFNNLNVANLPNQMDYPAPTGFEFALNLSRWRTEKKFVTTSLTFFRRTKSMESSRLFDFNTGYVPVEVTARYRSIRLDFIYSKVMGDKEMDDDFVWYTNLGFGVDFFEHYETVNYYTLGEVETNDLIGLGTTVFPSFIGGFGMQKNIKHNLSLNFDLNVLTNITLLWAIQPKVGLYYRLY